MSDEFEKMRATLAWIAYVIPNTPWGKAAQDALPKDDARHELYSDRDRPSERGELLKT